MIIHVCEDISRKEVAPFSMKITIVGLKQARPGYVFLYSGAADSCRQCDYFSPCTGSLEDGRVYTVTKVIGKELPCILQAGRGKVVEVNESDREILVDAKLAIPGAIITVDRLPCKRIDCEYRDRCFPLGLESGDKCKVLKVCDEVTCPSGPRLVGVLVQRQPVAS